MGEIPAERYVEAVEESGNQGVRTATIAERVGVDEDTARERLEELDDDGKITKVDVDEEGVPVEWIGRRRMRGI
jgi:DNA-binding Lrp family transcriptional regulator